MAKGKWQRAKGKGQRVNGKGQTRLKNAFICSFVSLLGSNISRSYKLHTKKSIVEDRFTSLCGLVSNDTIWFAMH